MTWITRGSLVLFFKTLLLLLGEAFRRVKVTNFSFNDKNFARRIVSPDKVSPDKVPGNNRAYQGGVRCQFPGKNPICTLSNLAKNFCPDITRYFIFFPVSRIEKLRNLGTVDVSHPVSRNFKIYFPGIPSKRVAYPTSRKSPAGPPRNEDVVIQKQKYLLVF